MTEMTFKIVIRGSSHHGSEETNLTSIHEDAGSIPGPCSVGSRSSVAVSCGVGPRHGLDLVLLWLWYGLAAAALIQPLAWEFHRLRVQPLKRQERKEGRRE